MTHLARPTRPFGHRPPRPVPPEPVAPEQGLPASVWLRAAFWAEVAFGLAAVLTLTLDPAHTARHFAWTLNPPVTAAALGAFYAAVAPSMLLAACTRHWHNLRVMVLPTVVFTASQLLVTLLHWDRFHHGSPAFAIWFASYLVPPVWLGVVGWRHQRQARPVVRTAPLPPALQRTLQLLGVLLAAEGLLGLAWPGWLVQGHAIGFTPLSARVASGWLLALGAVLLSMAHEADARRIRVALPFVLLVLPLLVLQLLRFSHGVDLHHPRLWAGATLLGVVTVVALRAACFQPVPWRRHPPHVHTA